jgi:phage terminase large subunit-like protein
VPRTRTRKLPEAVKKAIRSGYVPTLRDWRNLEVQKYSLGERVCAFIERYLVVPEGPLVGELIRLEPFQEAFILSIFDGPTPARIAILSVGRKAGKTALAAVILGAVMFMEELAPRLSRINSGALSREQAALIFNYLSKSISMSPILSEIAKITPSGKRIEALNTGIAYHALAAEAGTAMGLSPAVIVLDELGQVIGPSHAFADAMLTSQGAHEAPLAIIISTQAAADSDWLSIIIDDAIRNPSDEVVCHLYEADPDCELDDRKQWAQACPAMGVFRSEEDMRQQAEQAKRLPSVENRFRNLILNQRISLESAYLAPGPFKECGGAIDLDVFRTNTVAIGLDLSSRNDLTAAVLAAQDDEKVVHLLPFVFCPTEGIRERSLRDRAPYDVWIQRGEMIPLGGRTMDYMQICAFLRDKLVELDIVPSFVVFDRWGISHFKKAAEETGFATLATWVECGQGYKDFSPRCKSFESLILNKRVRHGMHPLLVMAFSHAVAELDPSGNVKLAKNKSSQRIDPAVAALMAAFQVSEGSQAPVDIAAMIA